MTDEATEATADDEPGVISLDLAPTPPLELADGTEQLPDAAAQPEEAEVPTVTPLDDFKPYLDDEGNWVTRELLAYEQHSWDAEVSAYERITGLPAVPASGDSDGGEDGPPTIPPAVDGDPDAIPAAPVAATAEHPGFMDESAEIPPEPV